MKKNSYLLIALSFAIVAFGQPSSSLFCSLLSSGAGFALFWSALFSVKSKKTRAIYATLWFTAVQSVQLSWMATPDYQGIYIFFVYAGLIIWLGLQFGLLSLLLPQTLPLSLSRILVIASTWTLIEWSRLFIFCGFSWNIVGLSMTAHPIPSQLLSLFGVFGLSFWVMVVNLFGLNLFFSPEKKNAMTWGACFLLPYLFGICHITYHDRQREKEGQTLRVALVQPSLFPDQKTFFYQKKERYVSPIDQWHSMIGHLEEKREEGVDLIVFPESAAPFTASSAVYPYEMVLTVLQNTYHLERLTLDSLLHPPYAEKREGRWYVNNTFWAQVLADHYGAEVIIGLDDTDKKSALHYAAAFHFIPQNRERRRYEKRVLVPLAEYLPLKCLTPLVARYGLSDFFTHGKEAKVFKGHCPLSISICYEECFGHLMREGRKRGASLFVNVTNDGWYPASRLPEQHFDHGRLRALENGIPLVRACNTGVTAGIDSSGRLIGKLGGKQSSVETKKGALLLSVDLYSYKTLYTFWGDYGIVGLSLICLLLSFFLKKSKTDINNTHPTSRTIKAPKRKFP